VVWNLGRNFVSDIQPADVAGKIIKYFDFSLGKRKTLSKKARSLASEYKKDKKIEFFKDQFHKLIEDMK